MAQQSLFQPDFVAPTRKGGRPYLQRLAGPRRRRRCVASGFVVFTLVLAVFYVLHDFRRSLHGVQHAGRAAAAATKMPDVPAEHTARPSDDISSSTVEKVALPLLPVAPARKFDQLQRHEYLHGPQVLARKKDTVDEEDRTETRMQASVRQNEEANNKVGPDHRNEADHQFDDHVSAVAHQIDGADERNRFYQTFKHVISLLPDELHMRELLRPFEATGKERLRDIGLRARVFKIFFEAWESLHLVWNDGVAHLRHDVVQYLRAHDERENLAQTVRDYESFRHFFQHFSRRLFPWTAPYFPDHMSLHVYTHGGGRGIALTAGDRQAPDLLASIPSFRQLGCTLPIEIMYLGDADLSVDNRAELESLPGVITRDLTQMVADEGWRLAGWAAKPFAILLSSFQEVIFIDADSSFFVDPTLLFDDPLYLKSGALFFRDRLLLPESKKHWLQEILARPVSKKAMQSRPWTGESGHMQESGVLVIDKWRHFVALLMVTRMNGPDRDGNKDEGTIGVYDMVYGDKETFWIGWELVGDQDYEFHTGDAGIMGIVKDEHSPKESDEGSDGRSEEDVGGKASEKSGKNETQIKATQAGAEEAGQTVSNRPEETHRQQVKAPGKDQVTAPTGKYTMCAPQLLHLDINGRPLWFNGGLSNNKFSKQKTFGRFEVYMKEPREIQEPGAWEIGKDNMCCLTSDEVFKFTRGEKDVLEMMIGMAKTVHEKARA